VFEKSLLPREFLSRRTMPLYQHSALHPLLDGCDIGDMVMLDAGSITDGDDHVWLGDEQLLMGGNWQELCEHPMLLLGKWKASTLTDAASLGPDDATEAVSSNGTQCQVSSSEDEDEVLT